MPERIERCLITKGASVLNVVVKCTIRLLGLVFALFIIVSFCACSVSASSSGKSHPPTKADKVKEMASTEFELNFEMLEKSGSDVHAEAFVPYPAGSMSREIDKTQYDVMEGLQALHAPNDCQACAEIHSMYKEGRVKRAFLPSYRGDLSVTGVEISSSFKVDKATLYQCVDGELVAIEGKEGCLCKGLVILQKGSWVFLTKRLSPMGLAY